MIDTRWYVRSTPRVWHLATDVSSYLNDDRWRVVTACGRLIIVTGAAGYGCLKEWPQSSGTICMQCHALGGFGPIGGDE